ncbi:hypothetical protein GGU45_002392 [Niabella hirudinis]
MRKLIYFLPFGYFLRTRLNNLQAVLFHFYAEYLLNILLLVFYGRTLQEAIADFICAYVAFISIYEIGYIYNDLIATKFEKAPKKRLGNYKPSNTVLFVWVVTRIIAFLVATFYLGMQYRQEWWLFYLALVAIYTLHNLLSEEYKRVFSFFSLATIRFYAPVFIFITPGQLQQSLPAVLVHYVFFRTVTYMDGKQILIVSNRATFSFKFNYYLLFIPLSVLFSFLTATYEMVYINMYFLIFWGGLLLLSRNNLLSVNSINRK